MIGCLTTDDGSDTVNVVMANTHRELLRHGQGLPITSARRNSHCQNVNLVLMILQYQGVYNASGKETLTTRKLYQNN